MLSLDNNVKEQHLAVRNSVGWYDFTHLLLEVTGDDAKDFLDKMVSGNISRLGLGRARYTTMLNEFGQILDDVIVFHIDENTYWVSTLYIYRMIPWFDENKGDMKVEYRDITPEWEMYSVQGPKSKDLVNAVVVDSVDDLKFFQIKDNKIGDIPVKVARSGYTGEKVGFEIYVNPEQMEAVEKQLDEKGKAMGATHVTEQDVMAMTLPAEAGFILITDVIFTTPFEAGLDWSIDWDKDFIGKKALLEVKDQEPKRKLLGFTVKNDYAKIYGGPSGNKIYVDDELVGKVTKYTHGFAVGKNIGYALVDTDKVKIGDKVMINKVEEATITEKSFLPK